MSQDVSVSLHWTGIPFMIIIPLQTERSRDSLWVTCLFRRNEWLIEWMKVNVTNEVCCLWFSVLFLNCNSKLYIFLTCVVGTDSPTMPISVCVWIQTTDLDYDSPLFCNKQTPSAPYNFLLLQIHKAQAHVNHRGIFCLLPGLNNKCISNGSPGRWGHSAVFQELHQWHITGSALSRVYCIHME